MLGKGPASIIHTGRFNWMRLYIEPTKTTLLKKTFIYMCITTVKSKRTRKALPALASAFLVRDWMPDQTSRHKGLAFARRRISRKVRQTIDDPNPGERSNDSIPLTTAEERSHKPKAIKDDTSFLSVLLV